MNDDFISRQAAIDVLEERLQVNGYSNVALVSELNRSIGYLMQLPAVEPKKGKWKEVQVVIGRGCFAMKEYKCEMCGYRQLRHENFCGRCGARMEKESE